MLWRRSMDTEQFLLIWWVNRELQAIIIKDEAEAKLKAKARHALLVNFKGDITDIRDWGITGVDGNPKKPNWFGADDTDSP